MGEIKVPELAESITEGTIARWFKRIGDYIEKGDPLIELETDKVNIEIASDFSGTLAEQMYVDGDKIRVGDTLAVINESETKPVSDGGNQAKVLYEEKREGLAQKLHASPAARKIAREKGINLQEVPVMDPLGRVRKQDVLSYQPENAILSKEKREYFGEENLSKPIIYEQMSRRRQTIAKRLVEVQQTAAMLTTFNEIDMTAVLDIRSRRKDRFLEEHDVRLGFMSFFTKAVVASLKKFPYLNAEIKGDQILLKKFYDIGVAVSTEEGLVVPVLRDADRKSFSEMERGILELAEKARFNKLAIQDLQGGTFTITNGGVFGSLLSTPILNGPQVGILGMHKIQLRPIAIDKERMENRPMMYIALSYDHRIVDGKEAVSFLNNIKKLLEDPEKLLLEG